MLQIVHHRKAFTLVELIVVITILAILAAVGFLSLSGYTSTASKAAVRTNLKSLSSFIESEAAVNDVSSRKYVAYEPGLVLSGASFSGVTLVPGAYGTPGTNYSAGTPGFGELRMDGSKFQNADGSSFLIAAMDWTETYPSGIVRSRPYFQVAGVVMDETSATGTVAIEGTYPVPPIGTSTGTSVGIIASSSGSEIPLFDGGVAGAPPELAGGADSGSTPSGTPVNGACGAADGTASATMPATNLCSAGIASAVANASPWTWNCTGVDGGTDASCSAPNTVRYVGCDTNDIILSNGQRWAACNVGAKYANADVAAAVTSVTFGTADWTDRYGYFFQWGRNDNVTSSSTTTTKAPTGTTASTVGHSLFITDDPLATGDWIATTNSNLWGGIGTDDTTGEFATRSAANQTLMQGPCQNGYHVPTAYEWCMAVDNLSGGALSCTNDESDDSIRTALKIPLPGSRGLDGTHGSAGAFGNLWMSSPNGSQVLKTSFDDEGGLYAVSTTYQTYGLSVRCLKNP